MQKNTIRVRQQLQTNNSWYTNQRKHTRDDGEKLKGCLSRGLQDQRTHKRNGGRQSEWRTWEISVAVARRRRCRACGGWKSVGADSKPKEKKPGGWWCVQVVLGFRKPHLVFFFKRRLLFFWENQTTKDH